MCVDLKSAPLFFHAWRISLSNKQGEGVRAAAAAAADASRVSTVVKGGSYFCGAAPAF